MRMVLFGRANVRRALYMEDEQIHQVGRFGVDVLGRKAPPFLRGILLGPIVMPSRAILQSHEDISK